MRLKKMLISALFPLLCGYLVASAHASRLSGAVETPPAALTALAHLLPRLAIPACAGESVTTVMTALRRAVAASGLLRDTSLSAAEEKQVSRALWAALESPVTTPDTRETPPVPPVLLPGQD